MPAFTWITHRHTQNQTKKMSFSMQTRTHDGQADAMQTRANLNENPLFHCALQIKNNF
jgi:hypothetical protein